MRLIFFVVILVLLVANRPVLAVTQCTGAFGQGPFGSATQDAVIASGGGTSGGTWQFVDGSSVLFVDGTDADFVN